MTRSSSVTKSAVSRFIQIPDYVPVTELDTFNVSPVVMQRFYEQVIKMLCHTVHDQLVYRLMDSYPGGAYEPMIVNMIRLLDRWFALRDVDASDIDKLILQVHFCDGTEASSALTAARLCAVGDYAMINGQGRVLVPPHFTGVHQLVIQLQLPRRLQLMIKRTASLYALDLPMSETVRDLIRSAANSGGYWEALPGGILADALEESGVDADLYEEIPTGEIHWFVRLLRDDIWPKLASCSMYPFFAEEIKTP